MSVSRVDSVRQSADLRVVDEGSANSTYPRSFAQTKAGSRAEKAALRLERDRVRGYTINVKQVVLAFIVEFWIISLIIIGTYLLIAESDHDQAPRDAIFSALLPSSGASNG